DGVGRIVLAGGERAGGSDRVGLPGARDAGPILEGAAVPDQLSQFARGAVLSPVELSGGDDGAGGSEPVFQLFHLQRGRVRATGHQAPDGCEVRMGVAERSSVITGVANFGQDRLEARRGSVALEYG